MDLRVWHRWRLIRRMKELVGVFAATLGCSVVFGAEPILKKSDVVFMYQASKGVYQDYGATVLAWGGTPNAKALEQAAGLKYFGSVGMVTEFARYYERFPGAYPRGLCRDLRGEPFKVPWLTDHQHKGVPYWWCCTRQPVFRQYISERVVETVKAGANGVHIDDHLGTAGALFNNGGCFCGKCVEEFRSYLATLPGEELAKFKIGEPAKYDYAKALREWIAEKSGRKPSQHPLWGHWRIYQLRGAASFMGELRRLAEQTAGKPVPMSANACLLWGPHLNDFQHLAMFSAEIEHHAPEGKLGDEPLAGYRLAEAVERPLAATASGGDWAFIKERNLPGMVQSWMVLSYAAGQQLMVPNRQWCYTPEKGTHWYEGPREKFAPLSRFVRQNAGLFDGYETHADVVVAYAQKTFDRDPAKFKDTCKKLAAANISYRLALGGDEVVEHALAPGELRWARYVLVLEPLDFRKEDREKLNELNGRQLLHTVPEVLEKVTPAVRVSGEGELRSLPRVKPGSAVIHLVNWKYELLRDAVVPARNVRVNIDARALGVPAAKEARLFAPGTEASAVEINNGTVAIPEVTLWCVLELR